MNKSELIEAIAKSAKLSKAAAGSALDGALSAIKGALKKNDSVTLVGFGTFKPRWPPWWRSSPAAWGCPYRR